MAALQSVRGTKDLLPNQIQDWYFIESVFRKCAEQFGYTELRTPIFEYTEVFLRGVGDTTDIVGKEMYTFDDKSGNSLTLRPEMTAALVRSVIQNSLIQQSSPTKLWYFGPFFRYERPQKGRYRQFHQFGAECLNTEFPESDLETILLANRIIKSLGIAESNLQINSLGNETVRATYKEELKNYLKQHFDKLSEDSQRRLEGNPLRVIDSKDPRDIEISANAPKLKNYFDNESADHFGFVIKSLDDLGIAYTLKDNLVRGLDYYSHTVFEFQSSYLGSQDSFGGGGRYNKLFEELGGKKAPSVGFAFGVERLLLILEQQNLLNSPAPRLDFYVMTSNSKDLPLAISYTDRLIKMGKSANYDLHRKSFKSQLKDANRLNARYVLILGEDEIQNNQIAFKNMETGEQITIAQTDFEDQISKII